MKRSCCLSTLVAAFALSLLCPGILRNASARAAEMQRIPLPRDGSWFLLGVNYPWRDDAYGHDFGTTAWGHDGVSAVARRAQVDADFSYLKSQGVHVVRWFLFCDGRAAPEFDTNGYATGFDEYVYQDLDAALAIAQKHDIHLVLVLLDYLLADTAQIVNGVQLGGRSRVISDPASRQAFLDNAIRPLLERYGQDPIILAWEVINEPEGAMIIPGGAWVGEPVAASVMQAFVQDVVDYIHAYSSQHATVGSASRCWLSYWKDRGLDFYQYHYYDHMEASCPFDYSYEDLGLDKPCIVGEFPTKNTSRTLTQYLDIIWRNGYAGALAWSYRADDESSDFLGVSAQFRAWSEAHDDAVDICVPLPVYRFWSPVHAHHFYTMDKAERDKLINNYPRVWTYEGVAYYAFADDSEPDAAPVYRFWSGILNAHFYTIDEAERDKLITIYSHVWTYEGTAFYAYAPETQAEGTMPVYRFWSGNKLRFWSQILNAWDYTSGHFYTMAEAEKDNLLNLYSHVWTYEQIAWYAYP